jgi:hypothetical protein
MLNYELPDPKIHNCCNSEVEANEEDKENSVKRNNRNDAISVFGLRMSSMPSPTGIKTRRVYWQPMKARTRRNISRRVLKSNVV